MKRHASFSDRLTELIGAVEYAESDGIADPDRATPDMAVRKLAAFMPISCCLLTDSTGVNHCQHPVPPPPPLRSRLRWRAQSWWSSLRMRLGSWVAGTDLDRWDDE